MSQIEFYKCVRLASYKMLRFHSDGSKAAVFLYNALMNKQVVLTLTDEMYLRAEQLAFTTGQDIPTALIEALDRVLPPVAKRPLGDPNRFFGMWADMTEDEEKLFAEIIAERKNYAPRPFADLFDKESR